MCGQVTVQGDGSLACRPLFFSQWQSIVTSTDESDRKTTTDISHDCFVNEPQFRDRRRRQHEWIAVGQAHSSIEVVQDVGQR